MTDNSAKDVTPLDVDMWPSALDGVNADMQGAPINVHKLMAHSPNLLRAWWDFRNYSVTGGTLGARLGELVILRVSVHLGVWYEWGSHVDRALRLGLSTSAIFEVLNARPNLVTSETLILTAVDELMLDNGITKPTRAILEEHFSTAQIMDLIAIQGMYVILGGFIKTWDLALDDAVADRIKPVTNRSDFERASASFRETIQS
jgi:alkylhydroperoxidase family enzyme